jgi:hypothetical protein
MSCKMIDALIEQHPYDGMWYTLNSPFRCEPGPNIHPALSDDPICQIAADYRLKLVPEKLRAPEGRESLLRLIEEIRQRCEAIAQAKKSRK